MNKKPKIALIIPARYKSSRFPGKPLVDILGKPMILRVSDLSAEAVGKENVYVATDDKRIGDVVLENDYNVIYTSEECLTGTDRVAEASNKIDADIYINVQGDEALLDPNDILKCLEFKMKNEDSVVTCKALLNHSEDPFNKNTCKMAIDLNDNLLYVSRNPIPGSKTGVLGKIYKQICIYAFSKSQLDEYYNYGIKNGKTPAESYEDIEIIRFLELGINVKILEVDGGTMAVDYIEDVKEVEEIFKKQQLYKSIAKKSKFKDPNKE